MLFGNLSKALFSPLVLRIDFPYLTLNIHPQSKRTEVTVLQKK